MDGHLQNRSEEDTFNALKREPFDKVRDMVRIGNLARFPKRLIIRIIKRGGWEPRDYMNQLAKEVNK